MAAARMPLDDALATVQIQIRDGRIWKVVQGLRRDIQGGRSLSDALVRHPNVFGPLEVQLVRVGEEAGVLDEMLDRLAVHAERTARLRQRVRLAMVYPALVLSVALSATAFLLTFVVPTFAELFAEFNAELPRPTQIVLTISAFVTGNAILILVGLISGGWGIRAFLTRTDAGRALRDRIMLRAPLLGPLVRKTLVARFCRTLGTLQQSGVSLTDALATFVHFSENARIRNDVRRIHRDVSRGNALAYTMRATNFFPPLVVQMIAAGEETAALDAMLLRAAEYYEEEVDHTVDTLTSIIEPLLIVLVGLVLGGILVALYLPMFDVVNAVG